MQWNFSRKSAAGKRSHKKTRKLRLEAVEQRQMLSVASPMIPFPALSAPTSAEVASQTTDVNVDFSGSGDLDVNVGESQTFVTQNGAGRNIQVASQVQGVAVQFDGTGNLDLNAGESETLAARNGAGHSTQVASQTQGVAVQFTGTGDLDVNAGESQTVIARNGTGQNNQLIATPQSNSGAVQNASGRSTQVMSQNAAVDAVFAGMGNASISAGNSETAFVKAR